MTGTDATGAPAHRSRTRVLVVDDEPDARALHTRLLAEHDVDTDEASDGEQALAMLVQHDYDLVLLDTNMPRLDGFAVLTALRDQPHPHPVVVVVSTTGRGAELTALGAEAVYPKPLTRERVAAILRELRGR